MKKVYKLVKAEDLPHIDYSLLEDDSIDTTRRSVNGEFAIIQYREQPLDTTGFMNNDEAIDYIESNLDLWLAPDEFVAQRSKPIT
jgi:hypothetical protein